MSRATLSRRLALIRAGVSGFALFALVAPAQAQRAAENAVAASEDAFGTSVGTETTGLYSINDARGFSPTQAGNVRVEGMYFDQQVKLNQRVSRGSTVRVGISAQSFSFPAPTGIADLHLRIPGDKPLVSAIVSYGPYFTYATEIDGQYPVITDKLNVGLGVGMTRYDNDNSSMNVRWSFGGVAQLKASDNAEVTGFWGYDTDCKYGPQPGVFPAGAYLPPRYTLRRYYGQGWTKGDCRETNLGALARVNLPDDWTIRAGVFRSFNDIRKSFGDFFRNVQPDGTATHTIIGLPAQDYGSYSGEVRASKFVRADRITHRFDFTLRGRDVERNFGGGDSRNFGLTRIGQRDFLPEPVFTFGPQSTDKAKQGTGGVSYDALWAGIGSLGLGIQKTFYDRTIAQPAGPVVSTSASPILYNASASVIATKDLVFYASYTRGLEESGSAPSDAANRNEAMPVSMTKQVDAGFRYALTPRLKLVGGVFQVEKPYFNVNAANIFGPLGAVRHRGVEVSVAGALAEGLTVVGGMILLQPRVSGEPVDRGLVGEVPVGPTPRSVLLNVQYGPKAWRGFSINGQITNGSAQMARSDNTLKIPGWTQFNAGARYDFKVSDVPASVRLIANNLTNKYIWEVSSSGSFKAKSPRNFKVILAADF
jgi:iron complex outermembrane receptor protein